MLHAALLSFALTAVDPAPTVAPEAPAEAITAGAPTWCDGVTATDSRHPTKLQLSSEIYGGMKLEGMRELLLFSCEAPADADRQKWVQAVRQSLSNDYALTAADNERLMKLAASVYATGAYFKPFNRLSEDPGCAKLPMLTEGTNEARFTRALERVTIGCGDWQTKENREGIPRRFGADAPPWWLIDFEGGLGSELAKAAFVNTVLTDLKISESMKDRLDSYQAWISTTAVPLDDAKFRTQLEALDVPEASKVNAILNFRTALGRFERQKAFVLSKAKADKGVEGMFVTGPEKARAQWSKDAAANPRVLELVLALEDRMTDEPGGMKGCGKQLFPLFKDWVKHLSKEDLALPAHELVMRDYVGSQLVYALTFCGLNDADSPVMDQVFGYYLYRTEVQRGPISASHVGSIEGWNAAQNKAAEGTFGTSRGGAKATALPQPKVPIVTPPVVTESMHSPFLPMDAARALTGVVAAVKTKGELTTISFKSQTRYIPTQECHDTNRIQAVTRGSVIYRKECTLTGTRTITGSPDAVTIPTMAAGGIKAGAVMRYWEYSTEKLGNRGWPVEVFNGEKKSKRVNLLGVQL